MRFRRALAHSHVAAVTIAILVFWAMNDIFMAVWPFLWQAISYVLTAMAIRDIPYFEGTITRSDRLALIVSSVYVISATVCSVAAILVSKCVYDAGPLVVLARYRRTMVGGSHAAL